MKFLKRSFLLVAASLLVTGCACQGPRNNDNSKEEGPAIASSKNTGKSSNKDKSSNGGINIDSKSETETYNLNVHIKIESSATYTLPDPSSLNPIINKTNTPGAYSLITEFDLSGTIKWDSWGNFDGTLSLLNGTFTSSSTAAKLHYEEDMGGGNSVSHDKEFSLFGDGSRPTNAFKNAYYFGMFNDLDKSVHYEKAAEYFLDFYLVDITSSGYLLVADDNVPSFNTFECSYSSTFRAPFIMDNTFQLKLGEQNTTEEPIYAHSYLDIYLPDDYQRMVSFTNVTSSVVTQKMTISK